MTSGLDLPPDFEAEQDLDTLVRAEKIRKDTGRVDRAKAFANKRADQLREMADGLPKTEKKTRFNGAVQGSKMTG